MGKTLVFLEIKKFLFIKTQKNGPPVTDIQPNGAMRVMGANP